MSYLNHQSDVFPETENVFLMSTICLPDADMVAS